MERMLHSRRKTILSFGKSVFSGFRGFANFFFLVHLRTLNVFRTLLLLGGLCLGILGFCAVFLLNHNISLPYQAFAQRVSDIAPHRLVVTSRAGGWLDSSVLADIPDSEDPVPVAVGFAELHRENMTDSDTPGSRPDDSAAGALLVGVHCDIESLIGNFECATLLEKIEKSRAFLPRGEKPLAISDVLAKKLSANVGTILLLPGGFRAHVVEVWKYSDLREFNDGHVVFGSLSDVALLLGHPGAVRAVYVNDSFLAEEPAVVSSLAARAVIGPPTAFALPPLFFVVRGFLLLLGLTAPFVGVLLGASVLLVTVLDRGSMRTILFFSGAPKKYFFGAHILEGVLVGLAAGVLAVPFGYFFGSKLTEKLGNEVLVGTGVSFGASFPWQLGILCVLLGGSLGGLAAFLSTFGLSLRDSMTSLQFFHRYQRVGVLNPRWGILGVLFILLGLFGGWQVGRGDASDVVGYLSLVSFSFGFGQLTLLFSPYAAQLFLVLRSRRLYGFYLLIRSDLLRSPLRTGSVIGVLAVGTVLLTGVSGLEKGVRDAYRRETPSVVGKELFVGGKGLGELSTGALSGSVLLDLQEDSRVERVWPHAESVIQDRFAVVGLFPGHPFFTRTLRGSSPVELEEAVNRGEVLLNKHAASELGVEEGDAVSFSTQYGLRFFRVGAVIDIRANQSGLGNMVIAGYFQVKNLWGIPATGALLEMSSFKARDALQKELKDTTLLSVYNEEEFLPATEKGYSAYLQPLRVIGMFDLVLASIGVFSMIFLGLRSRERERFAIRCQGFSARMEFFIVFGEALTLGLIGLFVGVAVSLAFLGFMGLVGSTFLMITPVFYIPWSAIFRTAFLVILICLLGAFPSFIEIRRMPAQNWVSQNR